MSEQQAHIAGMPYVAGLARGLVQHGLSGALADCIVVLPPGDFTVPAELPKGFIVVDAAPFSHGMIPLLGSGVPTVIIDSAQAAALRTGMGLLLNGSTGLITTADQDSPAAVAPLRAASVTQDGIAITLRVSARNTDAARRAAQGGAEAIGLVRSEFLLPDGNRMPDTAFYRQAFAALCESATPLPVCIRLIDIATDKLPAWFPPPAGATGTLGLQGVRLFAHEPVRSVYHAQLAAIDTLSARFDLSVMIPYLSNREELLEWSATTRRQLSRPLPVGAMAETPAAALQLADWLEIVDFVGLGCNDLMQCLFGADRDQAELRAYLDPYAPVLYRFLRSVAASVPGQLQRVQVCGVLAQLPGILPLLLGLGFRVFSVEAALLDHLRQIIAMTSMDAAGRLAEQACAARTSREVRALLANAGG